MKENIIYIRTSTDEQTPELQIRDCEVLANKLGIADYEILSDKISGWKEIDRASFDNMLKAIKRSQIRNIICWDLDRLYRNRKKLISFFELCKMYNCKVYSFRQQFLEEINKAPSPWNEIIFSMMLQVLGWLAEEESNKKSERTKLAVVKVDEEGKTIKAISTKGNKWGRKEIITQKLIHDVNEVHMNYPSLSLQDICSKVFYYDKNNNKKNPSKFVVWKILKPKNEK